MIHTALITGPTSGIGLELARLFARDGYRLILVARREAELRKVAQELADTYQTESKILVADLSQPGAIKTIDQQLQEWDTPIDVLVNNAGFGSNGRFDQIPPETDQKLLMVNVVALTDLTKLLLPAMLKRGQGKILQVASTAAFQPGPFMAVYYASKAYVLSFSEALANELEGTGVTVTTLCPGPTTTNFQNEANMGNSNLFRRRAGDPHMVAKVGYAALQRGQTVVVPGLSNWLGTKLAGLIPRRLVLRMTRYLNDSGK